MLAALTAGAVLPFVPIGVDLGFIPPPPMFFAFLAAATVTYLLPVEAVKHRFMDSGITGRHVVQRTASVARVAAHSVIEIKSRRTLFLTLGPARSNGTSEVPHMQVIPIIWPILLCAFLTGLLLGWVLFVALPRLRRAEKNRRLSVARGNAAVRPRRSGSSIVDADQQAIRRNA